MGRKNKTNLKQKIISIPIIIVTLLGFIIPNYAHANIFSNLGKEIGEGLIQIFMMIPDAVITILQRQMIDFPEDLPIINNVDESTAGYISEGVHKIPLVGGIAGGVYDVSNFVRRENRRDFWS